MCNRHLYPADERGFLPVRNEFQKWKEWSDKDYQEAERWCGNFDDYGIPWEEAADAINPVVSAEERFFEELERMEQEMLRAEQAERQIAGIRQALTRTQFRRFWLHHAEGMSVEQIAVAEGVSHQNISKSLLAARKRLKNFWKSCKTGCQTAGYFVSDEATLVIFGNIEIEYTILQVRNPHDEQHKVRRDEGSLKEVVKTDGRSDERKP